MTIFTDEDNRAMAAAAHMIGQAATWSLADTEAGAYYDAQRRSDIARHGLESVLAHDRYMEEQVEEMNRLDAIPRVDGHRAVTECGSCEACLRTRVLYEHVAYTLGYEGHPGAEQTAFHVCEECLRRQS